MGSDKFYKRGVARKVERHNGTVIVAPYRKYDPLGIQYSR